MSRRSCICRFFLTLSIELEIGEAAGDVVGAVGELDGVLGVEAAGVRHPLAAGHPLVAGVVAEGVAHPAVEPRQAHAAFDGFEQALLLLAADLAHGPDGNDQAQGGHPGLVGVNVECVGEFAQLDPQFGIRRPVYTNQRLQSRGTSSRPFAR